MFVPLPEREGEVQKLNGDFSKALYYRMKSSSEIERLIGYRAGRLREGWWLMFLTVIPGIDQFQYRGYSQMSGGIVRGHLPQKRGGPTAERRLRDGGFNLTGTAYQKDGMKQQTIRDVLQAGRAGAPCKGAACRRRARRCGYSRLSAGPGDSAMDADGAAAVAGCRLHKTG